MTASGQTSPFAGIIDESDILLEVMRDEARFASPVADAMISRIETVQADA